MNNTIRKSQERRELCAIIRDYSKVYGEPYRDCWAELYMNMGCKFCTSFGLEARRRKMKVIDYIEMQGLMPDALNMAREIFNYN